MKLQTAVLCISLFASLVPAFAQSHSSQPEVKAPSAKESSHLMDFSGPPDNSLWMRYMKAGFAAQEKGDTTVAKRYFLGSLAELEKNPPTPGKGDIMQTVKINTLERLTRETYPEDWSAYENKRDEELKLRKEQVDTLERIVKINQRLIRPGDLMIKAYQDRYQTDRTEYEKCLAETQKESAGKTEEKKSEENKTE